VRVLAHHLAGSTASFVSPAVSWSIIDMPPPQDSTPPALRLCLAPPSFRLHLCPQSLWLCCCPLGLCLHLSRMSCQLDLGPPDPRGSSALRLHQLAPW
ncbi:hypothetical protein M9458_007170, partial [Cirrhinus mrigala]